MMPTLALLALLGVARAQTRGTGDREHNNGGNLAADYEGRRNADDDHADHGENHGDWTNPITWTNPTARVRTMDYAALHGVQRTGRLAFVKFDPPACETLTSRHCTALHTYWSLLADQFPGLIWHCDCRKAADLCEMRGVPTDAGANTPTIDLWTGERWERYGGSVDAAAWPQIVQYIAGFLGGGEESKYDLQGWLKSPGGKRSDRDPATSDDESNRPFGSQSGEAERLPTWVVHGGEL